MATPVLAHFLMRNEGLALKPYADIGGGKQTRGYGHQLAEGEETPDDFSELDARRDLVGDIVVAEVNAKKAVGSDAFKKLDSNRQDMLVGFSFNIGEGFEKKFPKFVAAVLAGDHEGMKAEYKRFYTNAEGETLELDKRNADFFRTFMEPYFGARRQDGNTLPGPEDQRPELEQPRELAQIFEDPEFRLLSPTDREDYLIKNNEQFQNLWRVNPDRGRDWLKNAIQLTGPELEEDPGFLDSIMGGAEMSLGATLKIMSNAAMLIEKTGINLGDLDETWMDWAQRRFEHGEHQVGDDWYDILGATLGGLPLGLLTAAAFVEGAGAVGLGMVAAPVVGFGTMGALGASDEGPAAAAKAAAIEGGIGLLFPATQHLGRMARAAIIGTASLGAAAEHGDLGPQSFSDVLAMAALVAIPGKRPPMKVFKKATGQWEDAFKSAKAEIERDADAARQAIENLEQPSLAEGPMPASATSFLGQLQAREGVPLRELVDASATPREAGVVAALPKSEWTALEMSTYNDSAVVERNNPSWVDRMASTFDPGPNRWKMDWKEFPDQGIHEGRKGIRYRDRVIDKLSKAFKVPIHVAVDSPKGASGYYDWLGSKLSDVPKYKRRFSRAIRTKNRQDIQTDAHEFTHDLSFQYEAFRDLHRGPKFEAQWNDLRRAVYGEKGPIDPDLKRPIMHLADMIEARKAGRVPDDLLWMEESLSISYDKGNFVEGIAEFGRVWFTQDRQQIADLRAFGAAKNRTAANWGSDLANEMPHLKAKFEQAIAELPKKQREAIYEAKEGMTDFIDQGGQMSAMALTEKPRFSSGDVMGDPGFWSRQSLTDDLAAIRNLTTIADEFGKLLPDSVYHAFRLNRGSGDLGRGMLDKGVPTVIQDPLSPKRKMVRYLGKSLYQRLSPVSLSPKALDRYLRWQTAMQVEETLRQVRMPTGEIRTATPKQMESKKFRDLMKSQAGQGQYELREKLYKYEQIQQELKLAEGHPEYATVFKDMKDFANGIADFAQAMGLISAKDRAGWHRQQYVHSFLREMDTGAAEGQAKGNQRGAFSQLRGSSRTLKNPLESIVMGHAKTLQYAMENAAKRRLFDFLKQAEGGGRYAEIAKKIDTPDTRSLLEVQRAFAEEVAKADPAMTRTEALKFVKEQFTELGDIDRITMFRAKPPVGENIHVIYRDGKPEYYRVVDNTLARALAAVNRPDAVGVERIMNTARRWKQNFVTVEPTFMVANFVRDVAMSSIMSKTGNFHLWKALGGLKSALTKDQHYADFIANQGGGANISEYNPARVRHELIRHARRTGFDPRALIVTPADVYRALKGFGESMEIANRLGEFKAARNMGFSAQQSAYMGREVSTDFSMRGDNRVLNFFSHTVPFFNAMIAGGDRIYRGVAMDPTHRLATGVKMALVAAASGVLYDINRRIPEYMKLPDWDKWAYWHFFAPAYEDGRRARKKDGSLAYHHLKMPKLWEVGAAGSLVERTFESMMDSEDQDTVDLAQDMLHILGMNAGLNLFEKGFPLPLPIGVDSLVEQMSNRNLFTGGPIETVGHQDVEAWMRKRPTTSRTLSALSKIFRDVPGPDFLKSPVRAEALLRGFFGEWAHTGLNIADSILYPGGPSMRLSDHAIIRRFYEDPDKYDKNTAEFYDRNESFNQAMGTYMQLQKDGDLGTANAMYADPEFAARVNMQNVFRRGQLIVGQYNREIAMVREGKLNHLFTTGDEKTAEIDRLTQEMRFEMKSLNDMAEREERKARRQK